MKTLLTGGSGFIGKSIIPHIQGDLVNLDLSKGSIRTVICDLTDITSMDIIKEEQPDHIIHLAAKIDRSMDNSLETIRINTLSAQNVLNACVGLEKLKSVILFGSGEEYGNGPVPFREDAAEQPVSPYSLSKTITKEMAMYYYRNYKVPIVFLRPFVVYGGINDQFISYVIQKCIANQDVEITEGDQTRDFIHMEDMISGVLLAMEKKEAAGKVINLCSGKEYRIKEVAVMIKRLCNSSSKIIFGARKPRDIEILRYVGDNKAAKDILGWKPKYTLEEGLRKTISSHKTSQD